MALQDSASDARGLRQLPLPATVFRWASLALAIVLAVADTTISIYTALEASALAVAMVAALALMQNWTYRYRGLTEIVVVAEVAVTTVLIAYTGYWDSPFLLFAFAPVLDAGFLSGLRSAVAVAALAALAPFGASIIAQGGVDTGLVSDFAIWAFSYQIAGAIASYARRQAVAAADSRRLLATERRESAARLATIEDANALLTDLNEVAQILPAPLDLERLVQTTLDRLQELFRAKTTAMLLADDDEVRVVGVRGAVLPVAPQRVADAPPAVRIGLDRPLAAGSVPTGTGLDTATCSLLYAPLIHGGKTLGLLAVEDDTPERFGNDDIAVLAGLAGPVAVAFENARLFGRLRTLATSEERTRIARELHDRTAQHLAAIAFELDRLGSVASRQAEPVLAADVNAAAEVAATGAAAAYPAGPGELARDIDNLAVEIRSAIEELRNAIGDLRTDVSETHSLADLIRKHAADIRARSGLEIEIALPSSGVRLPVPQERELWRIFQEAAGNVIKHADATRIKVSYQVRQESVDFLIEDDGRGFDPRTRKLGHFGLTGMAERAEAIGARFAIEAREPQGTRVRVTLRRKS